MAALIPEWLVSTNIKNRRKREVCPCEDGWTVRMKKLTIRQFHILRLPFMSLRTGARPRPHGEPDNSGFFVLCYRRRSFENLADRSRKESSHVLEAQTG